MKTRDFTRREFVQSLSAATLGALAAGAPRAAVAETSVEAITPTADTLIILWMGGGMAATETFDPKRYTAFEKGMDPKSVLSTFPAIPTSVDGIQFSEGLERLAKVMDRGTLIRSYTAGDLGFILHSRHQYQWHTGYAPPQTVACPHIGAVVARTLGPNNPAVPAFINIGQRLDVGEGEELKAFTTGGFLGSEYGPFNVPFPDAAKDVVTPPGGMSPSRFENRDKFYRRLLEASPVGQLGSEYQRESLLRSLDNAHRLLSSPAAKAFDLTQESPETIAKYVPGGWDFSRRLGGDFSREGTYEKANIQRFGLGCLLARRLAEVGARFIEVTTEYIPFLNWDTHEHGHEKLVNMKLAIDGAIAQLILDLEERGRLDRTLIVVASEFSRDMMQEGKPDKPIKDQVPVPEKIESLTHYGMHRHFTDAGCVLLFGGGIKKGHVHGITADERPCKTLKDRVVIEDLHATIYRSLGISPKLSYEIEKRPFYVTRDGLGQPIKSLYAREV
ncbi:MAG TPA: DUF1501 domain-containing protein [Verrucomicrobiota bacterium]|nr:hypothetical protein [Verrucomicrobiales bacterium]HRI11737.1 DUF1501 domain-containing protein [Verrucomicrobiota bacterium]